MYTPISLPSKFILAAPDAGGLEVLEHGLHFYQNCTSSQRGVEVCTYRPCRTDPSMRDARVGRESLSPYTALVPTIPYTTSWTYLDRISYTPIPDIFELNYGHTCSKILVRGL